MYADFDTSEPPFSLLTAEQRSKVIRGMDILFIPAGHRIIEADNAHYLQGTGNTAVKNFKLKIFSLEISFK